MSLFTGSGVAMVTPFDENGVNYNATDALLEHIIKGGTDCLFVLGTTGEPSTMLEEEKTEFVKYVIEKIDKKIPVVVGSGSNSTLKAINYSRKYEDMGADGLLVVTPYYNKCTQKGAVEHYKAIADNVEIPIIAYNVPSRTGFNLSATAVDKLCDIKNIVGIKEASGDINHILDIARVTDGKIDLYSGDDSLTIPTISLGGKGIISVAGNVVPDMIHKMSILALNQNFKAATQIQFKLTNFMRLLFCEVNPIPCKKALQFLGIDVGLPRLPLTEMEENAAIRLRDEMKALKLI